MVQALLVPVDGSPTRTVEWGGQSLDELGDLLHCETCARYEINDPRFSMIMWVDEDGGLRDVPINHTATILLMLKGHYPPVRGDAVITGPFFDDDRILELSDATISMIRLHLGEES